MSHDHGGTPPPSSSSSSLFGPPLHETSRFSAPPSFHAQHHTPSAFLYGEHDHDHEHHEDHHEHHDHNHDHHDHHEHHDHHDHHDHSGHSHSHHEHSGHSHSHSGGGGYNKSVVSQRTSSPSPYQTSASPAYSSSPPDSPTLSNNLLSPQIGPGSSEDILQPSSQGYVFTAKANDGWVADDARWHYNYRQEGEEKTKASLSQYMKLIWMDKDAKNLFMFILLSTSFTLVEIMYGATSNSLGLISEAFHTIFDNIAMVISLIALLLARHGPNAKFSYGYDRIEILSGFANGAFLLFVSFFLFVESVERILEPPELHSHGRVISIAFIGLLINAVGIFFFSRHSLHRSEYRSKVRQDNMTIIMQHLFTDMLSGIGVIISSWLAQMYDWHFADTMISIFIAILIVRNAWPICSKTARVLLLTTPDSIYSNIIQCLREASTLEGVLEYHSEHFWTQAPGIFVGSLCVKVRSDANEQAVLQQVTKLFAPYIRHLTVQIEKDNWNL